MYIPENDLILNEVIAAYELPETLMGAVRYGSGHINDTFCLVCQPQEGKAIRFILQGLSVAAFPRQDELMENFIGVTSQPSPLLLSCAYKPWEACRARYEWDGAFSDPNPPFPPYRGSCRMS